MTLKLLPGRTIRRMLKLAAISLGTFSHVDAQTVALVPPQLGSVFGTGEGAATGNPRQIASVPTSGGAAISALPNLPYPGITGAPPGSNSSGIAVPTAKSHTFAREFERSLDVHDIERASAFAPRNRFSPPVTGTRLPPYHDLREGVRLGNSAVQLAAGRRLGGGLDYPSPEALTRDPRDYYDNPRFGEVDPRDIFEARVRQLDEPAPSR